MKHDSAAFSKSFKEGFFYPWGKPSRLWNALWLLLPIFGWFALGGYAKKIVQNLVQGHTHELPAFGKFWENFSSGFFIFIFMIPTVLVLMILRWIPFFGRFAMMFASLFLVPWLTVNFFVKGTFDSLWEINKAARIVFSNFVDYLFTFLKELLYGIVYIILSFVLVGIPCLLFGKNFFMADFYKRNR